MRQGITNAGQTMLARFLNGEELTFTGIKIGTGVVPDSTDILSLTSLINPCLSVTTIKVYRPCERNPELATDEIVIQAQYNNKTFTEQKSIVEYGIYAKIGTEDEQLYAYLSKPETPDNISKYGSDTYVTKIREFTLQVGNGTEVKVEVDMSAVYPTMQDFEEGLSLKINKESISTDNTLSNENDASVPSTKATKEYVTSKISELINNSPEALDTLKELAAALGDDANFATTVTNSLANKVDINKSITGLKTTRANNIFFLDSSTLAGALKIPLPQRKTNCFYSFDVEILNTINNKNTKLQINGFNRAEGCNYDDSTYTASLFHKAFLLAGEYAPNVAFYTGASEDYVLLDGVSDSFANCRIIINNIKVSNQNEDWSTFTVGLLTELESTLNSTQYLSKNIINANTETINFTSASGTGSNGVVIKSGLPIGTKKLIRKINSTQGIVEITCPGETFTQSGLTTITLNTDGDFWLVEKVNNIRWDLVNGFERSVNCLREASGKQTVVGWVNFETVANQAAYSDISLYFPRSFKGSYSITAIQGQPHGSINYGIVNFGQGSKTSNYCTLFARFPVVPLGIVGVSAEITVEGRWF